MQTCIQEMTNVAELVSLSSIQTRGQPRRYFDPEKLEQLVQSIDKHGILEPLLVRPQNGQNDQYELVAGERRYRAALKLGLLNVPVVIRQLTEDEAVQLALIENLQREDLNPVEETEGVLQLLAIRLKLPVETIPSLLYQMKNMLEKQADIRNNVIPNISADQKQKVQAVFQDLGLMSWLSFTCNRLPLLNLPEDVLDAIRRGKIAYTKALAIARVKDQTQRQILLKQAVEEELSLKQIRDWVKASKPKSDQQSPQVRLIKVHQRLLKARLWEDSTRWSKAQALLAKLEALLDQEPPLQKRKKLGSKKFA